MVEKAVKNWKCPELGPVPNYGTFGNHHVRAGKYKLAHISGMVRRMKMKLSPNCCARCGLSRGRVVVYRALWPSAKTCRNEKI